MGLDDLITEARSGETRDLDLRSTEELVGLMNQQDAAVPAAVASSAADIAAVIDAVVERLQAGGRLVYVGAGSSGRLAAVDASECESTFSSAPGQVVSLLAGADAPSSLEQEAAEDDAEAGRRDVHSLGVAATDAVIGISASGRTPYVLGAIEAAAAAGAATACIVSVPGSQLGRLVEREIAVVVGPELLAGSTRLKAGTAQKLVLNMISTISMIRLGKTFDNLMVDVNATNEKLRARVQRIVMTATGAPRGRVDEALAAADGSAKVAIVTLLAGVDVDTARARLAAANGNIRLALEP
jgi:N-acetylmuramic acid 6-phosphate etherase